ncbi:hypothetical protein D3C86_1039320 [compost metagenome]
MFREGEAAAIAGKPVESCRYRPDSFEARQWAEGHVLGMKYRALGVTAASKTPSKTSTKTPTKTSTKTSSSTQGIPMSFAQRILANTASVTAAQFSVKKLRGLGAKVNVADILDAIPATVAIYVGEITSTKGAQTYYIPLNRTTTKLKVGQKLPLRTGGGVLTLKGVFKTAGGKVKGHEGEGDANMKLPGLEFDQVI